jgi:hypothetical protein
MKEHDATEIAFKNGYKKQQKKFLQRLSIISQT